MATRTQSRIAVIQLLYAKELGNENAIDDAKIFFNENKIRNKQQEFALSLLYGVCKHEQTILDIIDIFVKGWDIHRLGIVEKNILKLGAFELLETNTQKAVVINEAIEIAKMFNLEDACRLINAVLDGIAKTHKDEIAKLVKERQIAINLAIESSKPETTSLYKSNTKQHMRFKQEKNHKPYSQAKQESKFKKDKRNTSSKNNPIKSKDSKGAFIKPNNKDSK